MADTPIKVAHVMRTASRSNAGVFVAASGLVRALGAQRDIEPAVFAARDAFTDADRRDWGDAPVFALPALPPGAFSYTPGLANAMATFTPDIVHQHGLWLYNSVATRTSARRRGSRTLISIHGMLTPWALENSRLRKQIALKLYERGNLEAADCLHATSEAELEHLRQLGLRAPIALVPFGVFLPAPPPAIRTRAGLRTMLSLGRLHPVKGLDNLIRAWASIHPRFPDWQLKIAGPSDGKYGEELKALAQALRVERLEFAGPLYGPDKESAYAEADVFVLPSHSENFAITVIEALSHGVPVVASKAAPWSALVLEKCGWWEETDAKHLAATLGHVAATPPDALAAMGKLGRAWVGREFSWPCCASRFSDIYRWLTRGGGRPKCVSVS